MRDITPEQYAEMKGWPIRKRERTQNGVELVLDCPICGKKCGRDGKGGTNRPFYINTQDEKAMCNSCGWKGNLLTLMRHFGDATEPGNRVPLTRGGSPVEALAKRLNRARGGPRPKPADSHRFTAFAKAAHANLLKGWPDSPVAEYLRDRGFVLETIEAFGVGEHTYKGNPYVVLPTRRPVDGEVVLVKMRIASHTEKDFRRLPGGDTELFGYDEACSDWKRVYVAEGELDAMALWQMGLRPVVACTAGARSWQDSWSEDLVGYEDIVLVFDSDDAGQEGAKEAASKLGRFRCSIAKLPHKDPAECLRQGVEHTDIRRLIENAVPCIGDVIHISTGIEQLRERKDNHSKWGATTGWHAFDELLGGGLHTDGDGEVVVLTGETGTGKTTWMSNLTLNVARNGVPTLTIGPEMKTRQHQEKMLSQVGRKLVRHMDDPEFATACRLIAEIPHYITTTRGSMPFDDVVASIEYAVRRRGVQVVVADHLDFFCEDASDIASQERTVKRFSDLANTLGICLLLVAHPRKTATDYKTGRPRPPDLQDIKGASAIRQYADAVIRIYRERSLDRSKKGDNKVALTALKVRDDYGSEGSVVVYFDPNTLLYSNLAPVDVKGDCDED